MVGALLAASFLASCRHSVREGEREESFRPFLRAEVGGVPLGAYLERRTAFLLAGTQAQRIEKTANGWDIKIPLNAPAHLGLGSAIAISSDGYFLTAAHNLGHPPFTLAILADRGVAFAPATLVWSGNHDIPEQDFAILKAPLKPGQFLRWGESDLPKEGAEIASMSAPHGCCGGRVLETSHYSHPTLHCDVLLIHHDLPLLKGDSGGPVVGRDGRFIGMNVLQVGNLTGSPEGLAVRPDWRWIATQIENAK